MYYPRGVGDVPYDPNNPGAALSTAVSQAGSNLGTAAVIGLGILALVGFLFKRAGR